MLDGVAAAVHAVTPIAAGHHTDEDIDGATPGEAVAAHLHEVGERTERLGELLYVDPHADAAAWQQHGALLAAIDRLRVEIDAAIRPPAGTWRPAALGTRPREALRRSLTAACDHHSDRPGRTLRERSASGHGRRNRPRPSRRWRPPSGGDSPGEPELADRRVPEDATAGVGVGHLLGQQAEQRAVVDAFGHAQERPVRTPHAPIRPELTHQGLDVGQQVAVRVGRARHLDAPGQLHHRTPRAAPPQHLAEPGGVQPAVGSGRPQWSMRTRTPARSSRGARPTN